MPSKNTGKKVIKKVKVNKKNVIISFTDGEKLDLSPEVMANFYIYEGKELTKKQIAEIIDFSNNALLIKYALSLLRKRHYSEWKMREKLYAKEAEKKDVDKVIKILKDADLIDDRAYAFDLKEYLQEKNYGKNKIINYLSQEGIFDAAIKELKFPSGNEKKKAINQLPKLEKRYAKYPYEQKKQHIYNALINLGFDNDIALSTLEKMKDINVKDEKEKLDKDFPKIKQKYQRKYEGRQLKEKIISSLRNKDYKMKDILRKFEDCYGEDDFGI